MKTCIYFAENLRNCREAASFVPGFGFSADGLWRSVPLPSRADGILIDDRRLPNRLGLAAAIRALREFEGVIVLDFERRRVPALAELTNGLRGKRLVIPPAYADLPHEAILIGPWQGESGLSHWLSCQREKYGSVMLDALPLCLQCYPGGRRKQWRHAVPESGFFNPALSCLHRRLCDGSILLWDTRQTLHARLEQACVPAILFRSDWEALPEGENCI